MRFVTEARKPSPSLKKGRAPAKAALSMANFGAGDLLLPWWH
ncbi:hypothetical protein [Lysobacter gummosus]